MNKMKVCMFFNDLALYRRAIYKMLDNEYDCEWFIENTNTGVKEFNETELKIVKRIPVKRLGPLYVVKGLSKLLKKDYEVFFMLGATRNLSLFIFLIKKRLFFPRKRVYLWTHGYYGKESWLERVFWKRTLFKLADGIFTYGDYAKKLMVNDGFTESIIHPIHNSLDYERQLELRNQMQKSTIYSSHFKNDNPVLIFIGRLTEVKRLDMLLTAVSILKHKNESYNVVFVGDGNERQTLESLASTLDVKNQVWFYGASYDETANAELIYNADLCVAPGNIGLTAIHVLMFGCPAVSHNNFSFQMPEFESIKPVLTGDFYEYGKIESLADKISDWFASHNDRAVVRESCYREIDKYWNPYYQMNVIKEYLK